MTAHLAVLRRNFGAQLLGVSRRGPARLRTPSFVERVTEVLTPATVHATVVCGDSRELHVVHRGQHVTPRRKPAHALARTVIPLDRISRVTATDHERLDGARVIDVRVGGANLLFSVASGSETERALLGAAPR
ncbi:hypothetical protein [Sanguibacter suaedae]|uniref:Uncharacterized protein n=1 Tax=Sanguibacter suaedae TaxID=2795737 RepID=A0A934M8F1_9MICO|nr:hypothetical protein [Sanguibacter suaedae]MBI9113500.1 hypothetical protein [Sanguibacter suaedae]